jgi:antigen flippase
MGFFIVAKAEQAIFFGFVLAWTIVSLGLAWICVGYFGLNGAGIAFFGSYIFHGFLIYMVVRRLSGFRWSIGNERTGLIFLSFISIVFCGFYLMPLPWASGLGIVVSIIGGAYSVRTLLPLIPQTHVPAVLRSVLAFRLIPSSK